MLALFKWPRVWSRLSESELYFALFKFNFFGDKSVSDLNFPVIYKFQQVDLWHNGTTSDSRSEGCMYDSSQFNYSAFFHFIWSNVADLFSPNLQFHLFSNNHGYDHDSVLVSCIFPRSTSVFLATNLLPTLNSWWFENFNTWICDVMVARLTPDQKVAC